MNVIPLPKLPNWIEETELREAFQDYGREAVRAGIDAVATLLDDLQTKDHFSNYFKYAANNVRAMKIEGET